MTPPLVASMVPDLTPAIPGILFGIFAGLIVASSLFAAFSKKIVHAAFGLMAAFFGVAAMYGLLGADFLALTQIIVYVGGILILIVFGVLLTGRAKSQLGLQQPVGRTLAAMTGVVLLVALLLALWKSSFHTAPSATAAPSGASATLADMPAPVPSTARIGRALLSLDGYVFPFELVSVFLLVSLVGAAYLVRRRREGA